jgi:hypothetical protein
MKDRKRILKKLREEKIREQRTKEMREALTEIRASKRMTLSF